MTFKGVEVHVRMSMSDVRGKFVSVLQFWLKQQEASHLFFLILFFMTSWFCLCFCDFLRVGCSDVQVSKVLLKAARCCGCGWREECELGV